MDLYEVRPLEGLGPFHLGMTEREVEEVKQRLFAHRCPDSACRTEYEGDALSGVALFRDEYSGICYRGMDLTRMHVEDLIPHLAREAGFDCDCVDPELANTYSFPALGLELWRERVYHPKLLERPQFQELIGALPESLDYEQEHGWTFSVVWVRRGGPRAAGPLEAGRAPYDGGASRTAPRSAPPTPGQPECLAAKYGLQPPGTSGAGV